MKRNQFELPGSGQAFNLAGERGIDPERIARDLQEQAERQRAAAEYERRMQRILFECPGVLGFDSPTGPGSVGKVVVDPCRATDAALWLKRRFRVAEEMELSCDTGLVFSIATRKQRLQNGGKRIKVHFGKPQQFELALA